MTHVTSHQEHLPAESDVDDRGEEAGSDGASVSGVRSLDRPFIILRVLREGRAPMRLTEISTAAQLHLATTQRIVNLLIRHGYVEREGVQYRLGLSSFINGNTYLHTNSITQLAEPVLLELTASTALTSMLYLRNDLSQVLVMRILSTPAPRYQLPLGEQVSLMVGGARVFAASLDPDDLERLLEGVENVSLASGQVLDRPGFVQSLESIRVRGYAFGQGQGDIGEVSIAVPVFNRLGEVVASIQVAGMIEDIPMDSDALIAELKRASAAITRRIP